MKGRFDKRILILLLVVFVGAFALSFLKNNQIDSTEAASFNAGNIISNYTMGNYNSMSVAEIQSFLDGMSRCNTDSLSGGYYSGNQYIKNVGGKTYRWHLDGDGDFICLNHERFGDGGIIGSGKTAAELIYDLAHQYGINPQVVLVLLQKEQGILTDPYPNDHDYGWALGYGAYDYGDWDTDYAGFKEQLEAAFSFYSWFIYEYDEGEAWWDITYEDNSPQYIRLGDSNILYHPDVSCGYGHVYIENTATVSLYVYTPYQPDNSVPKDSFGEGGHCGSYGNRNFSMYFRDYFGDPQREGMWKKYEVVQIPDGNYYIKSTLSQYKSIDADVSMDNVQLYDFDGTDAQIWKFKRSGDGYYTITNTKIEKVVDVNNADMSNGTNIKLWNENGSCAQKWKLLNVDGYITFVSACSNNMVIDVSAAGLANSTNIQLYEINGTNAQKWQLIPVSSIEDGVYNINSKLSDNKVIDIAGGVYSAQNGTNIQLYESNETIAQRWYIESFYDGTYSIINPQTGKSLDVSNAGTMNGANIQLYESNGTCAQRWYIVQNEDDFTIMSTCSYKTIDVAGGSRANNTNIQLYEANNTDAQKWKIKQAKKIFEDEDIYYEIVSALDDNKVMDVDNAGTMNGANIQLYEANNTNAQKWKIQYNLGSDAYIIKNPYSDKVVDVDNAGTMNGANIQLYESNGTCAQRWYIVKDNDGYVFMSACSNKVIDVSQGSPENHANIQLYEQNGTKAQKWYIK